jgi:hypothetical protein
VLPCQSKKYQPLLTPHFIFKIMNEAMLTFLQIYN